MSNILQSVFGDNKVSDRLFTEASARSIRAANIREREKLIHISRSIERARSAYQAEYRFKHTQFEKKATRISDRLSDIKETQTNRTTHKQKKKKKIKKHVQWSESTELFEEPEIDMASNASSENSSVITNTNLESKAKNIEEAISDLEPGANHEKMEKSSTKIVAILPTKTKQGDADSETWKPSVRRKYRSKSQIETPGLVTHLDNEYLQRPSVSFPLAKQDDTPSDANLGAATVMNMRRRRSGLVMVNNSDTGKDTEVQRKVSFSAMPKPSSGTPLSINRRHSIAAAGQLESPLRRHSTGAMLKRRTSAGVGPSRPQITLDSVQAFTNMLKDSGVSLTSEQVLTMVERVNHKDESALSDPTLMTDEERRIFQFLRSTDSDTDGARRSNPARSFNRVYVEDPLRRLSHTVGADVNLLWNLQMQNEMKETQQMLEKSFTTPLQLPPINSHKPRQIKQRKWLGGAEAMKHKITEEEWENLRYCRYLRSPSTVYNSFEAEDVVDLWSP